MSRGRSSGRLEIAMMISFNVLAAALPFVLAGEDPEERTPGGLVYGGILVAIAFSAGLAVSIGFRLRGQRGPMNVCALLALTPPFVLLAAAQVRAAVFG